MSELGVAGAQIGLKDYMASSDPASATSVAQIERMLDRALDLTCTYVDTVPDAARGSSGAWPAASI